MRLKNYFGTINPTKRKLRLFAVALALTYEQTDENLQVIYAGEQYADGLIEYPIDFHEDIVSRSFAVIWENWDDALDAIYFAKNCTTNAPYTHWYGGEHRIDKWQHIIDDIFYTPIQNKPQVTGDIKRLANDIYWNKNFQDMPILADMLEDHGFPDEYVQHCRQPYHTRGCWVLDNLLGQF